MTCELCGREIAPEQVFALGCNGVVHRDCYQQLEAAWPIRITYLSCPAGHCEAMLIWDTREANERAAEDKIRSEMEAREMPWQCHRCGSTKLAYLVTVVKGVETAEAAIACYRATEVCERLAQETSRRADRHRNN